MFSFSTTRPMRRFLPGVALAMLSVLVGCQHSTGKQHIPPMSKEPAAVSLLSWQELAERHRIEEGIAWVEASDLYVEGRGWEDTDRFWNRLPSHAEGVVPGPVWDLSRHTAGMAVRFASDAQTIRALWSGGGAMNHMAASGVSGLDLYRRNAQGGWDFCSVGRPLEGETTVTLVPPHGWIPSPPAGTMVEYLLFLPLYQGVTRLELGFNEGATVFLPPAQDRQSPIVFYGTSITQGGCASRTGMAHPAILRRWLDREVINLGFSGMGKMEPELAHLMAELDPAIYVIDCLPNMTDENVSERVAPFVRILREARPTTPILLVEDARDIPRNDILRGVYQGLLAEGVKELYLLPGAKLMAGREEGTVDGIHPTDLGFLRMAETFEPALKKLLVGR